MPTERLSIAKGTREVYQLSWVVEGWGWLYADEDEDFSETISKHIDFLCDVFSVSLVNSGDEIESFCHWETAESFTFEGNADNISKLKKYIDNCPTLCNHLREFVDKELNKMWSEYHEIANARYNQGDLFEWADEEERYAEYA